MSSTDYLMLKEALELGNDEIMSANYLGSTVLQLAGFDGLDPYFDYLNQMRSEIPVIWKGNYLLKDGTYSDTLNTEQSVLVDQLRNWEYYKLKYETVE